MLENFTSPGEELACAILRICCFCSSICRLSSSIFERKVLEAILEDAVAVALLPLLDEPGLYASSSSSTAPMNYSVSN